MKKSWNKLIVQIPKKLHNKNLKFFALITSTIAKKSQFLFDLTSENGTPCYKENQKPLKITIDIQKRIAQLLENMWKM